MRRPRSKTLFVSAVTALLLAACGADTSVTERQGEVRDAGAKVMPFDLDKTKHSFVKTETGGVQTVIALDPTDVEQVRLVREHLEEISVEFAAGRFDDPTTIHGDDMPGVQELATGAADLKIIYREVEGGGEITYTTTVGALVGHLHDWFDAQVSDHGSDAVSEPFGHTMTEEMWRAHHPGQPYPGESAED
jgi:hypothetical protein